MEPGAIMVCVRACVRARVLMWLSKLLCTFFTNFISVLNSHTPFRDQT